MDRLRKLQESIDTLSLRGRLCIFLGVLFVMYVVWDMSLMRPLMAGQVATQAELQQKQAEQQRLNLDIQRLLSIKNQDPDTRNRQRIAHLEDQIERLSMDILRSTRQLVPSEQMAALLEAILLRSRGLELVAVQKLAVEPLFKGSQQDEAAAYRHGLKIMFKGDYMSALNYIRKLEGLRQGFFWDSLEFKVTEYPESLATLTLFTLSMDEYWIGI